MLIFIKKIGKRVKSPGAIDYLIYVQFNNNIQVPANYENIVIQESLIRIKGDCENP